MVLISSVGITVGNYAILDPIHWDEFPFGRVRTIYWSEWEIYLLNGISNETSIMKPSIFIDLQTTLDGILACYNTVLQQNGFLIDKFIDYFRLQVDVVSVVLVFVPAV